MNIVSGFFHRLMADLKRGVYYQKCHDPECKLINFKSSGMMLSHRTYHHLTYIFSVSQFHPLIKTTEPIETKLSAEISSTFTC